MRAKTLSFVSLAVLAAALASPAAAQSADHAYTMLMGKGPSGTMVEKIDADGTRHVAFEFNDRGRGPNTHSDIHFGAHGEVTALTITGNDYMKAPVDEHFALDGGKAIWTSKADTGSVAANPALMYVPFEGNSENLAIAARALLAAPNGTLDLLPGGRAHIEKVATTADACGGPCAPGVAPASLYLITGFGFDPAPVWLDDATHELLFEGSSWSSMVVKGDEAIAPRLVDFQSKLLAKQSADEAKQMQDRTNNPVLIQHATLFDTVTRRLIPHTTVRVENGKIAAVGPDGKVKVSPIDRIVDAHGQTLMPGLTDMHVHLGGETDGKLYIVNGVTTVRDMGNDLDALGQWENEFNSGEQIGPRVWKACLIDGKNPLAGPTKLLIATPDEAHAVVKTCYDHGFRQMKIYSSVDPSLVPVIIADAHARGMRVSGHIPAGMTMTQGVEEGYDEVQHANFWFLNFRPADIVAKTNGITRLQDPAEHARELDLDSPQVKQFIALLQAYHTVVDPTLVAFEDDMVGDPHDPSAELAADIDRLPPQVARGAKGGSIGGDAETRKRHAESFQRFIDFTGRLHKAGIRIVGGTDGMAGFPLVHEFENYVAAGLSPSEVMQLATLGDAQVMHHDDLAGSVAPGKNADLILIDGDPTKNISELRKVTFVMKGGVIYDLPAIERSIGVKPLPDQH